MNQIEAKVTLEDIEALIDYYQEVASMFTRLADSYGTPYSDGAKRAKNRFEFWDGLRTKILKQEK